MQNDLEKPALYADPKLALEIARSLKAVCPDTSKDLLQDVYGVLTERDLVFYQLGYLDALNQAKAAILARLAPKLQKEEG